jgi:hypothetical protein
MNRGSTAGVVWGGLMVAAGCASTAVAQIHEGDVLLVMDSGSILTHAQLGGGVSEQACVFGATLSTGSTNDPGFDTQNGAFGSNQSVFLDIVSHLREWDGEQFISAAPTQIRITRGFDGPVFSPSEGSGPALGFPVTANSSGKWHKHYLFTLTGDQPDGIYALELQLRTASGVPGDSSPFWFVFNKNLDNTSFTEALSYTLNELSACGEIVCVGDIADDFGSPGADGQVSFGDFLALLGLIGPCPGGTPGCAGDIADDFGTIGNDGQVSFGDFLALLGLIGPCP